jgi:glycosyltransferase involved in cell wall biosynthesis
MRICYVADASNIHTQRWVKYFADKGHEVHLISTTPFEGDNIGNIELYLLRRVRPRIRIISALIDTLSCIVQIRKLVRKIKPDILHAHYISENGFLAALSGFHPLVLTGWGSDVLVQPQQSRIYRYFVEFALKRADLITSDGENMIEEMIKLGADPDKINYLLHGVDTQEFNPQAKSLKEEHEMFDSPLVISARTLMPIYNLETLIQSVPLVLAQIPKVKFVIAGDGSQKYYLGDLAQSLGVLESVSFIGRIPRKELPYYLAAADVYVSTSLSDTTSVSLLEAMACGLAPVVTDVGDVRKWIKSGENGFIIPIKRPDLLAEKIICLLENGELREKMAKANRQLIEERADYEQEMGKMGKLYEELIRRSRR